MAQVNIIAVIGAGAAGCAIAQFSALGGYTTILEDLLPNARRRADGHIRSHLDSQVQRGTILPSEANAALKRLQYAETVEEAARGADLVIEAVPEELESKIEIFTLLDKICRPGTLLASHSLSLSITEISSVTYRAAQCLGMRFLTPEKEMARVELVRSPHTDEDTVVTAIEVVRRMGLSALVVSDFAGENLLTHPAVLVANQAKT